MRWKILIITLFIGVMIIIGTASADKPEIKGVTKHPKETSGIPITVIAKDDTSVTTIEANTESGVTTLTHQGGGIWMGHIREAEELKDITIEAHHNSDSDSQNLGHGGCPSRMSYDNHTYTYTYAHVDLLTDPLEKFKTIFSLHTEVNPLQETGVIGICIYPEPGYNPGIGASLLSLYDSWQTKHNPPWDYFGFGRMNGKNYIPLNGIHDIPIGSANYTRSTNSEKILMHILDKNECSRDENERDEDKEDDDPQDCTCWRRPGTTTPIPEFSTVAIPIAAVLGLVFFFQHRKKKEE